MSYRIQPVSSIVQRTETWTQMSLPRFWDHKEISLVVNDEFILPNRFCDFFGEKLEIVS